jgi:hypothetical protein
MHEYIVAIGSTAFVGACTWLLTRLFTYTADKSSRCLWLEMSKDSSNPEYSLVRLKYRAMLIKSTVHDCHAL